MKKRSGKPKKPYQKVQKKKRVESSIHSDVVRKIQRVKTSGKMMAIMGALLGEKFTEPRLVELIATSDGHVLGMGEEDIGFNEYIGSIHDFIRNVNGMANAAELTITEKTYLAARMRRFGLVD